MSTLRRHMKDSVLIVKADGQRLGPYKAAVFSDSITIMEAAIDVDEGDYVSRTIPSGKEELYLVLSAIYSQGLRTTPPHYTLEVRKTTALPIRSPEVTSTTINIHNSTGVQVGDYNTQHIQATFNELIQRIEQSSAESAEKAEAKSRLAAFLAHPLVSTLLGTATGAVLETLGGG